MTTLATEGLVLHPLDTAVVRARLAADDFELAVPGLGPVHFGPEYPGDLLVLFPLWLAAIEHPSAIEGTWTIIDTARAEAVGAIGTKGPPDDRGLVEVGYGINPAHQGGGIATAALGLLVAAIRDGQVELGAAARGVTACTRVDNTASQRVLQKVGFEQVGTRHDAHDGPQLEWLLVC